MFWVGFVVGLLLGGFVGIFVIALCVIVAGNDEPHP